MSRGRKLSGAAKGFWGQTGEHAEQRSRYGGKSRPFLTERLERRVLLSSVVKFATELTTPVGTGPLRAVTADLNGDGKPDVITSNYYSGSVTVLLSNGNGTFGSSRSFAVGTGAYGLALADVNGDGKLDLAVVNSFNGSVSILLGNGNGTFLPQQTFAVGSHPRDVVIADFNDDGKADLLVSNNGSGSVSLLLGNGNGTFRAQTTIAVGASPGPLAAGHLHAGKSPDVVVGNLGGSTVGILLANSNGTFQALHTAAVGSNPTDLVLADFNHDGNLDLAVANDSNTANTVSVLLGTGKGDFQARKTFAAGTSPPYLVASDINGDGKLDLAVANYSNSTISALVGNGDGTFLPQQTIATTTHPGFLLATDMDGDGTPDLVSVHRSGNAVGVLQNRTTLPTVLSINRNNPSTTSSPTVSFTVTFSKPVVGVDAGDFSVAASGVSFTGVTFTPVSSSVYTFTVSGITGAGALGLNLVDNNSIHDLGGGFLAGGSVTFASPRTFYTGAVALGQAVADVNGDGRPDLVLTNSNGTASVLLGNGNGTFGASRTFSTGTNPDAVAVADVNGDGKPDLVVANSGDGSVSVLLGNGDGTFQNQRTFTVGTSNAVPSYPRQPISVFVADVNGDGKPDLVTGDAYYLNIKHPNFHASTVLLGNGNGTFGPPTAAEPHGASAVTDFNGDGRPDILTGYWSNYGVLANAYYAYAQVSLGDGNGNFAQSAKVLVNVIKGYPTTVAGDVNGDGRPDAVAENRNCLVMLGNGDGTFASQYVNGVTINPIALGDLNGDGYDDLLNSNGGLSVLLSNGDGTFRPAQSFAAADGPLRVSDLNGDGRLDVMTVHATASNTLVTVLTGSSSGSFVGQVYTIIPPASVSSITRSNPSSAITSATSLSFAVGFTAAVNNVSPTDFQVIATGSVIAATPVVISGSGSSYTVTINGVHGSGTLQLDLVDHDTIIDGSGTPLGGFGLSNGSFAGQSYTILQTFPTVLSINRTNPPTPTTVDKTVTFTVTFNEPVTGVDPTDFALALSGVTATTPVSVSGSGASYTVTISGISGTGTLGLNLVDDGSIKDAAGNPLQNGSGGQISFQSAQTSAAGVTASFMTAADVNGDGRPDLIVANRLGNAVSVMLGNGNGTFAPPQTFVEGLSPYTLAVCDVNGDGVPDLVAVSNRFYGSVNILLGNGTGGFALVGTVATDSNPHSIVASDVNGDGKIDLVLGCAYSVSVLLGRGDGTFQPQQTFAAGARPTNVYVSDVNGDGKADLVAANSSGASVSVLLGNGNGTFAAQQTFATQSYPQSVAVADMNGDGVPDLIIGTTSSVAVLLGNGNGTFQPRTTFTSGGTDYGLVVADVNGDGNMDVAMANYLAGRATLLLGNGNGMLHSPQLLPAGSAPLWLTSADFNSDGRTDLATANGIYSSVSVLSGIPNGNFTGQFYIIVPPAETIAGTSNSDTITLTRDTDGTDIDWSIFSSSGSSSGILPINDPNGLTINGNGGNDTIVLSYTNGNPLPNFLHLNGVFTLSGLQGTNPIAATTLEIGRSTVFIGYSGSDPIALIKSYLQAGYNSGAWNGTATASTGVITSSAAAANHTGGLNTTAIGYADSVDGQGVNTVANTIELTYTLYGDANLDHQVNSADLQRLLASFNTPAAWDQGDFNYDGVVNSADLQGLLATFNTSVGNQIAAATLASTTPAKPSPTSTAESTSRPQIGSTGSTSASMHHLRPTKPRARKRR
jgi:hypothetical protein